MGDLVVGAHQLGQGGVHLQSGQDDAVGVRVTLVVVQAVLIGQRIGNGAPDGGLGQLLGVGRVQRFKGQRVQHHQALEFVGVFLLFLGVVKQGGHNAQPAGDHRADAHHHQAAHQQARQLAEAAALHAVMLFVCHHCHVDFPSRNKLPGRRRVRRGLPCSR